MRRITSISLLLSTLLLVSISSAQQAPTTAVPNLIRYGGVLKDAQGAALSSTVVGVTFAIYKQQDGGAPVWMETQNVTLDASGNYSVLLGSTTAIGLPGDLFSQQEQRWLGVQVQGQAEQPRVLLVSVPYAFKAHEAETLGGRSVSDFVLAENANSSANGSDTGQATASTASNLQSTQPGTTSRATSQGPTNFSGSTTDHIVEVAQSGTGTGVSATAASNAVVGTATGRGTAYGVWGVSTGTGGAAVLGTAQATTGGAVGVKGSSISPYGTGVRGIETSTTGSTKGVSAYVASAAGTAGVFDNAAGGKILSGRDNNVEKFSVDGSGDVTSAGRFTGSGAGLTGIQFSQLGGLLGSAQFSGSYSHAVTLSNTANVFYGDGSHLTGTGGGGGNYIWNGTSQQPNANFNISGSGTANAFNSATGYQIGGSSVLSVDGSVDRGSVFLGVGAGTWTDPTYAAGDTFIGDQAGHGNQGYGDPGENTFTGYMAGYNNTDCCNTFYGDLAGYSNTIGAYNVITGDYAGAANNGSYNNFYGDSAGSNNTTGSHDIYIGNYGPPSGTESNTIRIGGNAGDYGPQTAAYIAGIYGSTAASGIPVYVNSDGKLGTMTSSLRFKEQVRDMGEGTNALLKLRPVTFLYKPEYDKGERTLQYGLIAEEVAKVYPELVAYDKDGQPYTVRYQYITTMLLNEVQKQYHRAERQNEVIETQQKQIEAQRSQIEVEHSQVQAQAKAIESLKQQLQLQNATLQQRLSRLETLVGAQVKIAEGAAPSAGTQ